MSELVTFDYINNSLTTIAQARCISKIGSYFKVPQKVMRESLNETRLKEDAVIQFDNLAQHLEVRLEEYYTIGFKINLNDFLSFNRFQKSKFYSAYTLMRAGRGRDNCRFVVYDKEPFILVGLDELELTGRGLGGFILRYPPVFCNNALIPLQFWLESEYPLPS